MSTEERFKHYYEFSHPQWLRLVDVHKEDDLLLLLEKDKLILSRYVKPFGFKAINPHIIILQTERLGWRKSGWRGKRRIQRRVCKCANVV